MPKVILAKFDQSCINDLYLQWLNNKEFLKFSRQSRKKHSFDSCLQYLKSFENTSNIFWSVQNENNEILGTMTAYIDKESQTADLGIMIGKPGQGYGKTAWGEALDYLFHSEIRKITGGTLYANKSMIAIFEHWGMQREGLLRKQELLNGVEHDVVRYGLLKEEWLSRSSK